MGNNDYIKSPIQLNDDELLKLGKKMDDFIDQLLAEGGDELHIAIQSAASIQHLVSPQDAIKTVADMLSCIAENVDENSETALITLVDELEIIANQAEVQEENGE